MIYLYAAILGTVQGLTEFLPVSSSAHLILARAFFGWNANAFGLVFDVACHAGTVAAILVYFRADVGSMVAVMPQAVRGGGGEPGRELRLIVVGTIPAIIVGLLAVDVIDARLRTPVICATALAAGALLMIVAERGRHGGRGARDLGGWEALAIGCAQAAAFVPGVSRSGITITLAMLLGLRREAGARFTFLLAIPVIVLAALRAGAGGMAGEGDGTVAVFAVGALTAALVGYATIGYFLRYVARHTLTAFAVYRLALAAAVVVWLVV